MNLAPAIQILLVLLPIYLLRFNLGPLPTTALEILLLLIFAAWLWLYRRDLKTRLNNFIQPPLWRNLYFGAGLWLIAGLVAVGVNHFSLAALGLWRAYFLEPILLFVVIGDLLKRRKITPEKIIFSLNLSALICAVWAISQPWLGGGMMSTEILNAPQVWRATGPFPQSNFLGLFLGPIIILGVGQIFKYKKANPRLALFYLATFLLSMVAIVMARSQGAALGVAAGLASFGWTFNRKYRRQTIIIAIILLGLAFAVAPSRNYLIKRIEFQTLSEQLRLNIWQGAADMIKTHPLLGVGLRGYQELAPKYQKFYYQPGTKILVSVETHPYPHDLFLAIWAELGLYGLLIFLLVIVQFFLQLKQDKKLDHFLSISLMAAITTILVHGLVDTPYFKNDLAIIFWVVIALAGLA